MVKKTPKSYRLSQETLRKMAWLQQYSERFKGFSETAIIEIAIDYLAAYHSHNDKKEQKNV